MSESVRERERLCVVWCGVPGARPRYPAAAISRHCCELDVIFRTGEKTGGLYFPNDGEGCGGGGGGGTLMRWRQASRASCSWKALPVSSSQRPEEAFWRETRMEQSFLGSEWWRVEGGGWRGASFYTSSWRLFLVHNGEGVPVSWPLYCAASHSRQTQSPLCNSNLEHFDSC